MLSGGGEMEENSVATGNEKKQLLYNSCAFLCLLPLPDTSFMDMNNIMPPKCQQDDTKPQAEKRTSRLPGSFQIHALNQDREKMLRPSNLHKLHFHNFIADGTVYLI
jgi:hypothetical protein